MKRNFIRFPRHSRLPVSSLRHRRHGTLRRRTPLTICIAAIAQGNQIYAAADRMLSGGDIEFEPRFDSLKEIARNSPPLQSFNTKIAPLTNSIVLMMAGVSALQSEITQFCHEEISKRMNANKDRWIKVFEAAEIYMECYAKAKKRRRDAVYASFGLTEETYLEKHSEFAPKFLELVTESLSAFESNFVLNHEVETIVTGVDDSPAMHSAHIYTIRDGEEILSRDSVGFAAIGTGARHAKSQFMLGGHHKFSTYQETVLLTYMAKKRSEIAPGVGEGTDMFNIGPNLGSLLWLDRIPSLEMEKFERIYRDMDKRQKKAFEDAKRKTADFLHEFQEKLKRSQAEPATQQTTTTTTTTTTTPPPVPPTNS